MIRVPYREKVFAGDLMVHRTHVKVAIRLLFRLTRDEKTLIVRISGEFTLTPTFLVLELSWFEDLGGGGPGPTEQADLALLYWAVLAPVMID